MKTQYENCWVWSLGDYLTCEILDEMATIRLERDGTRTEPSDSMDEVGCVVEGDYQMRVQFRAEHRLFRRLAEHMTGETGQPEELVQEYAKEFVNTLCGRFVSEIYHMTKIPARFYPVEYRTSAEAAEQKAQEPFSTIRFKSDEEEYAEFSWSQGPMEELLKRSECQ